MFDGGSATFEVYPGPCDLSGHAMVTMGRGTCCTT